MNRTGGSPSSCEALRWDMGYFRTLAPAHSLLQIRGPHLVPVRPDIPAHYLKQPSFRMCTSSQTVPSALPL